MRAWAEHRLKHWWVRRRGVPAAERPRHPARAWWAAAVALAAGGAAEPHRIWACPTVLVLAAGLLAVAATRPAARWRGRAVPGGQMLLWAGLAAAAGIGGERVRSIDRSAAPPAAAAINGALVTLDEPLAASSPERSVSARAVLGHRHVVVVAPRFAARSPALPRGAIVRVTGRLVPLGELPGDARLRRAGLAARLLSSDLRWSGSRRGGLRGTIDRFSAAAQRELGSALGPRRGALVSGMALGVADDIAQPDTDALRASGLAHLIAASGGNIALVTLLVLALGWAAGISDRWRLALAALAICAYVPLAGAGPSIQRAGVMGLAGILAMALGRERRAADALALAAAATLAVDPRAVLDIGWQLSFVAAAALIGCAPAGTRRLLAAGVPRWLAATLACSLIATVATAPLSLLAFGQVSVIGLVANALVLPLTGVAVWSGALAAALTPLSPAAAGLAAQPAGVAAGLTLAIATWSEHRSFAVVAPAGAAVIALAAGLLWIVRPPRAAVAAILAAAAAVLVLAVPRPPAEPRLLVFDIGQGNAALLQDGTSGVLVDTGPVDGGIVGELRRSGVRRLRAVVLSHPAADHDGGAAAVLAAFPVDLVLDGGEPGGGPTHDAAIRIARRRGVRVVAVRAGQRLAFGRIVVQIRWPTPRAARLPGDPNDRAAVVEASVGTVRALLPADAEGNVLRTLHRLSAAVVIISHHGSSDAALPIMLARLHPQLAVISSGAHNTYGHPTHPTLAALRAARTPTLRTDQAGSIDIRADPSGRLLVRPGALR